MPALISSTALEVQKREIAIRLIESRAALNLQHVAQHLRISERTLQRWRADDKDFDRQVTEAMERARLKATDAVENKVFSSALDGDTRAGIFLLQAHKPDRYRPDTKGLTNNGTVININQLTVCPREIGNGQVAEVIEAAE